jgi:hypothetical protein
MASTFTGSDRDGLFSVRNNERVYSVKILDLEQLNERIESEFENLFSQNICETICASVLQRCNRCIANGGGQFEHLV